MVTQQGDSCSWLCEHRLGVEALPPNKIPQQTMPEAPQEARTGGLRRLEEVLVAACWGPGSQAVALALSVRSNSFNCYCHLEISEQQLIHDAIHFHGAFTCFYLLVSVLPHRRPQKQQ